MRGPLQESQLSHSSLSTSVANLVIGRSWYAKKRSGCAGTERRVVAEEILLKMFPGIGGFTLPGPLLTPSAHYR